jgi:hypothetical protein
MLLAVATEHTVIQPEGFLAVLTVGIWGIFSSTEITGN